MHDRPLSDYRPPLPNLPEHLDAELKKLRYELINGKNGFEKFCDEVSERLNAGWKPIGGVAFNAGIAYQSMAKAIEESELVKNEATEDKEENKGPKRLGANEAMRQLDSMT